MTSTCQGDHVSSERVQNQTGRARLHWGSCWNPSVADQHVKFCAAAGVAAHGVVLVEVYLARVHHFPAWTDAGSKHNFPEFPEDTKVWICWSHQLPRGVEE